MKISKEKMELIMARNALTLREISKRSGISSQNISTIRMRGQCLPITAAKLANGLGVDVTEILEEA